MIQNLTITVLVDNQSNIPGLLREHGLSVWIEADDRHILFDTGQSGLLIRNAEALGIDLKRTGTLVLSHGHYDHTGGVPDVLKCSPSVSVYCHPAVFLPRYSRQPEGGMKPIGITSPASSALQQFVHAIHWTSGPTYISADIGITGPIPRISPLEDTGGAFFLDPDAQRPDPIDDDLAMWFRTTAGLVVVTGCCHSGFMNTLTYIRSLNEGLPLHAVMGGFHLLHATPERMDATCDFLQKANVQSLIPCHCSGKEALEAFRRTSRSAVTQGEIGFRLTI